MIAGLLNLKNVASDSSDRFLGSLEKI